MAKKTSYFPYANAAITLPSRFKLMPVYFAATMFMPTLDGEVIAKSKFDTPNFKYNVPHSSYLPIGSDTIQKQAALIIKLPKPTYITYLRMRPRSRDDVRSDYELYVTNNPYATNPTWNDVIGEVVDTQRFTFGTYLDHKIEAEVSAIKILLSQISVLDLCSTCGVTIDEIEIHTRDISIVEIPRTTLDRTERLKLYEVASKKVSTTPQ
jgi:hypothetical protein